MLGYDDAANRRALLARLARHFAHHFLDEQIEFHIVGRDVRRQDGAIERIGFAVEGYGLGDQVRIGAQLGGRGGRACKRDEILAIQTVQQVARGTDHQLQTAGRQQARFMHHAHDSLRQVARRRGRLGDAGHGSEKTRCEFFQQTPDGEIEGVDVHGQAAARHQDVRAGEAAFFTERDGRAFVQHVRRRQLVAAHAGVGEQGARAAFDIDPAIGARGARQVRDRIQLLLALDQVQGQRLEARGALLEVQRHQARHARLARIRDGFVEVDLLGMRVIDDAVVQGAMQGHGGAFAQPAASDQALQGRYVSHVVSPLGVRPVGSDPSI